MRVPTLIIVLAGLVAVSVAPAAQPAQPSGAPETFTATAEVKAAAGAITAAILVHIQRYTPDFDRTAAEKALAGGGYPAFLTALRKAPEVGSVAVGDQKVPIRWAREQKTAGGRTIVVVTDGPLYFVGGGRAAGKSRSGYEVAVVQLRVDEVGAGTGTMAAAARVKPGGETGVQIDDYAEQPINLTAVRRK